MKRWHRLIRSSLYLRRRWPVQLAVGAIFRNEASYLTEWLEFHHRQGVERFYLYDNNSTDDWERAVAPYRSVVDVQTWSDHPGQFSAYSDCLRRHRWDTRWVALIDLDEFLFSPTGQPLPAVLQRFSWVAAVAVNWRCYGTSGHETPPDGRVAESYAMRGPDGHPLNRHVKSIVFPAMSTFVVQNPHFFLLYGPTVGERGDCVTSAFRDPPTVELLRINHYITRSQTELHRKLAGPRADLSERRRLAVAAFEPLNAVSDPLNAGMRRAPAR